MALTTASFDRHLTRSDVPLVVDFWAPWCGPCRMMEPHYEAAARQSGAMDSATLTRWLEAAL